MTNQDLSKIFLFMSGVKKLKKADQYRIRAYDNASAAMQELDEEWSDAIKKGRNLVELPGIGEKTAQKLKELYETGNIKSFQRSVKSIPQATWPLWEVHGIGVIKAYTLAKHLKLKRTRTAIQDTMRAAKAGKVRNLPHFGEKSEQQLIEQLEAHTQTSSRMPFVEAEAIAKNLIKKLKKCSAITRIEPLGSLRRKSATVGDIDLGIATDDAEEVREFLEKMPEVKRIVVAGESLIRVQLQSDLQVDIKIAKVWEWGGFIQHFTGSKNHNIKLRELALSQDKSLSEHGIKIKKTGNTIAFDNEKDFYAELGLKVMPPEVRVGGDEIEEAKIEK